MALMKRIKANYNGIVGFNGALVGGGVLGIMPQAKQHGCIIYSHWVSARKHDSIVEGEEQRKLFLQLM